MFYFTLFLVKMLVNTESHIIEHNNQKRTTLSLQ